MKILLNHVILRASIMAVATLFIQSVSAQNSAKGLSSVPIGDPISTARADGVKITFDEKDPSIMIVESNGEKYRVNSVTKQIDRVAAAEAPVQTVTPPATIAKDEPKEDFYAFEPGDEPFDYRLVNVPTPKKVPKGTWNMTFSHRFSQPLQPFRESGPGFLGLDSMSVSSFGISYGITDKFYVQAARSPLCQKGLCRTIELGVGYHITDQNKRSPVALSTYASIEGNDNFTEEYTYNLQLMLSRQFGRRLFAFFSPALHLNSNGQRRFNPRPDDYFPAATVANTFKLPTHGASFGMGATFRITPTVMGIFEFTPRTGFKLGKVDPIFDPSFNVTGFKNVSEPEMGAGVQYSIGKHSFTLTLSNTQTTTTSKYNSSNRVLSPRHLIIGFNLFRRW